MITPAEFQALNQSLYFIQETKVIVRSYPPVRGKSLFVRSDA